LYCILYFFSLLDTLEKFEYHQCSAGPKCGINDQVIFLDTDFGLKAQHSAPDAQNFSCTVMYWRNLLSTVTVIIAVLLAHILQCVECTVPVYSIIPKWLHLMVLQYVAASFHLPWVSNANMKRVQYPKTVKQCEIPTIPAVVISKLLLPQSKIMAAFVRSNSSLFFDVSSGLTT